QRSASLSRFLARLKEGAKIIGNISKIATFIEWREKIRRNHRDGNRGAAEEVRGGTELLSSAEMESIVIR
ncbi:MAG TPA: hypothetical protein VMU48_18425, partial [Terracidiphilus sp.]|nr:hypothetical protein [Terracidiphilus sp.]